MINNFINGVLKLGGLIVTIYFVGRIMRYLVMPLWIVNWTCIGFDLKPICGYNIDLTTENVFIWTLCWLELEGFSYVMCQTNFGFSEFNPDND